jgi:hypothetical protein
MPANVVPAIPQTIKATDCVSISELADALSLPAPALISAIERNKRAIKKPFYSIPDLAKRWNCSRASVYNILRESEFKLLNLTREGKKKGHWNVPASVVERIEQSRAESLSDKIAA